MTEAQLISEHPSIFIEYKNRDKYQDPIAWYGIECGDGWLNLLSDLCNELDEVFPDQIIARQVKQKFGTLRFYFKYTGEGDWLDAHKVINKYVSQSAHICEECGNKGNLNNSGWIKCLCKKCEKNNV